jgi:hypothetical protein
MERDQAYKEMHGYRELDRNMQGLIPRATNLGVECALTNLGVADAVVNDLLSTAHSQFRDFVPREDFIPRDPNVALNCVRGEASKTLDRASPAVRNPFKPEGDENRVQQRLISPAAFEPQYSVQASSNDFSLHSSTCREEIVFDYDLSKVSRSDCIVSDLVIFLFYSFYAICYHESNAAFSNYLTSTSQDAYLKMFIEVF